MALMLLHTEKRQSGAATLVAVMVLFFIMAMVAAYAGRNLLFEQRIANNFYRSTLALDVAEAGAEWALKMLNSGDIDGACLPTSGTGSGFRQRYLNIDANRTISSPYANSLSPIPFAACVNLADSTWQCQCPANGVLTTPALPNSTAMQPMFEVRVLAMVPAMRSGTLRIQVAGCTDLISNCSAASAGALNVAGADLQFDAALVSALKTSPATPLTVRGNVDLGSTGLGLTNSEPGSAGLLMQVGGNYSGSTARMNSLPGTPVGQALISGDASLASVNGQRMFGKFFGMAPATYQNQPAMRVVSCAEDCGNDLLAAFNAGARMLWVEGNASISSNISLGSAASPVVLIVNGNLSLDGPMLLAGVIHARGDLSWSNTSAQPARLSGALMAEGNLTAQGTIDVIYSAAVMNILNNQQGSFVRVPGSWSDVPGQ